MTNDDGPKIPIPHFIRSILEPYRRIDPNRPRTKERLEPTYIPPFSRPTKGQHEILGRIATSFSVLERILGMMLARLSLAPDYPTMALTKDLSLDNQLKAVKILLDLHGQRYAEKIMTKALRDEMASIPSKIATLKDERNVAIHTVWLKTIGAAGESVRALAHKPMSSAKSSANPPAEKTNTELNDLADRIQKLADDLFVLVQMLPAVDEGQHVEFLAQAADRLHREILPTPPDQPESSGE